MSKLPSLNSLGEKENGDTRLIFKVFSVLVQDCPDLGVTKARILGLTDIFGH
jgi:hypothetical protein